ncbi:hypothetical protein MTR67_002450 [Solanum verrucosum]|uniref:Uncharacterized protein n=1 Tax=Solanum verrucosum TaxID=315347 RepID=A0AAF0PSF6_SOLVR|nr:hypothetical protein MTR67_002450 [Solanum verrucosum]
MGAGAMSVTVVSVECVNTEEAKFEEMYNKEVKFLAKQGGVYHTNYPRKGRNQNWNRDEGWRDRDRELRDRNPTWKERDVEKDRRYGTASRNCSAMRWLLPLITNLIFSFKPQHTGTLGEVKVIR